MAHEHFVTDSDEIFAVDISSKVIKNESGKLPALVQFDNNSERFTFVVPRFIEGHDITECEKVEVIYRNVQDSDESDHYGKYKVTDLKVNPDDEKTVIFTWLISDDATQYAGKLTFSLRVYCVNKYRWNTKIFEQIPVAPGMPGDIVVAEITLAPEYWYERIEEKWM